MPNAQNLAPTPIKKMTVAPITVKEHAMPLVDDVFGRFFDEIEFPDLADPDRLIKFVPKREPNCGFLRHDDLPSQICENCV